MGIKPVYVFDSPRTCSQVFGKLWMAHPQLEHIFMSMMGPSIYGPNAMWRGRKHGDAAENAFTELTETANASSISMFPPETYKGQAEKIQNTVSDIQGKGQIPWIKDHTMCVVQTEVLDCWLAEKPYSTELLRNPTPFPVQFLEDVTPIFLVRHPALSIPSFFRKQKDTVRNKAHEEDFRMLTSLEWTRLIFDSYLLRSGLEPSNCKPGDSRIPLVIESQDFIYKTDAVVDKVCAATGLDKSGVQFEWQPTPEAEQPPSFLAKAFFQDMFQSTGIKRADVPAETNIDLDKMSKGWEVEFDLETATALKALVEKELPNYEYLRSFKINVN